MTTQSAIDWDRRAARRGTLDGQFLVGSPDTGTYSLPSCETLTGRQPALVVFASEAMAKAAGLRACKVCRPERFHATLGDGLDGFNALTRLIASEPTRAPTVEALAQHAGWTLPRFEVVLGDHAQMTSGEWHDRERIRFAASELLTSKASVDTVAGASAFSDTPAFEAVFAAQMGMTPKDYRKLGNGDSFRVVLPSDYRTAEVLAYQGRDPEGLTERSDANRVIKALATDDGPVVVEIMFAPGMARVKVHSDQPLSTQSMAGLHRAVLKILGLGRDITAFERKHPSLAGARKGLRVPLIPSAFDALAWAIMGQQINLSFAGSLRRDLIRLAGARVGDMIVHPTPEAVASLDPADLTSRRFSRSKTNYLIAAAQSVVNGTLPIETLVDGSAVEAERLLTAQHGVGVWTARYVLMRCGFADAAPVGDSGLSTALQKLHGLAERPDATATARWMAPYSPWRSLASAHLWGSLATPPPAA